LLATGLEAVAGTAHVRDRAACLRVGGTDQRDGRLGLRLGAGQAEQQCHRQPERFAEQTAPADDCATRPP
jgi:hypothetical protein